MNGGIGTERISLTLRIQEQDSREPAALASSWPSQDFLELGALPGAVPCARLHTRHVLREWNMARLADPAELLVSELLTNAIRASRIVGPPAPVRLWLGADKASVLIMVWDASPHRPAPCAQPQDDAEGGRGLLLVEAISARWGWYSPAGTPGKVTWALVR
jgi:anti-sigma regulatory factor (Ser/Thr protein kinase)